MPSITITFDYPKAEVPKYKFGDRIVVKENCHPQHWLTGEVIGLTLEQEVFKPHWSYTVVLDASVGYTEEYSESELVPETEIVREQLGRERSKTDDIQTNQYAPPPKFQPGMRVRLNAESGFQNLIKDCAEVISSKYVSNESWSGWTYKLTNKDFTRPVEIGEIWLELAPTTEPTDKHSLHK